MKKGFTIVELVIVIAVIAILAAVLIPTFSNVIAKANESKALQGARNAFTIALAEVISDDGKVTDADDRNDVTTTPIESSTNFKIAYNGYEFTVNGNGQLQDGTNTVGGDALEGYTITVASSSMTKATKN